MPDGEYEDYDDSGIELARATATDQYSGMMRRYLDELTIIYENMMARLISNRGAEEAFNACVAKMLSIMTHLLPKIEGGGDKTQKMREEFEQYKTWIKQVQKMKINKEEMDKVPDLYNLIVRAYDKLGLTSI